MDFYIVEFLHRFEALHYSLMPGIMTNLTKLMRSLSWGPQSPREIARDNADKAGR